jgi:hypothetical protein
MDTGKYGNMRALKINNIELYKNFVRELYVDRDKGHDFSHIERIIGRIDELSPESVNCKC